MDEQPESTLSTATGRHDVVSKCPRCAGTVEQGYVGTNGRVFWSDQRHLLSAFGDEVLIPIALLTTSFRPASICRTCDLVAILYDSADAAEPDLYEEEKLREGQDDVPLDPPD